MKNWRFFYDVCLLALFIFYAGIISSLMDELAFTKSSLESLQNQQLLLEKKLKLCLELHVGCTSSNKRKYS